MRFLQSCFAALCLFLAPLLWGCQPPETTEEGISKEELEALPEVAVAGHVVHVGPSAFYAGPWRTERVLTFAEIDTEAVRFVSVREESLTAQGWPIDLAQVTYQAEVEGDGVITISVRSVLDRGGLPAAVEEKGLGWSLEDLPSEDVAFEMGRGWVFHVLYTCKPGKACTFVRPSQVPPPSEEDDE